MISSPTSFQTQSPFRERPLAHSDGPAADRSAPTVLRSAFPIPRRISGDRISSFALESCRTEHRAPLHSKKRAHLHVILAPLPSVLCRLISQSCLPDPLFPPSIVPDLQNQKFFPEPRQSKESPSTPPAIVQSFFRQSAESLEEEHQRKVLPRLRDSRNLFLFLQSSLSRSKT